VQTRSSSDAMEQWEKFLEPEVVRQRLFNASLFITAFELLKDSIVGRLRDFYCIGFDASGPTVSEDYEARVLRRSKSVLYASLDWLRESDVIDADDLAAFERIRKARNGIAHALPALVFQGEDQEVEKRFPEAFALMKKIEVWWVLNLEIPTNPDYDGQEIDESGVVPGAVWMFQLMMEVASGNTTYLEEFKKANAQRRSQ
jgi:hypothetical protein